MTSRPDLPWITAGSQTIPGGGFSAATVTGAAMPSVACTITSRNVTPSRPTVVPPRGERWIAATKKSGSGLRSFPMICSAVNFFPRGIYLPPLVCTTRDSLSESGDV
jgi:hypothetical protein